MTWRCGPPRSGTPRAPTSGCTSVCSTSTATIGTADPRATPLVRPATVRELYRARASAYDRVSALYRLFGFRHPHYRRQAVRALALSPGSTVVDLACGTGLNFPALQAAVGPEGRIIGVDLTDAMLEKARARVHAAGWDNVELVESDMAEFEYPASVHGVITTLALSLSPAYDHVVERAAQALAPGGRVSVLDLKFPERWPSWAVRAGVWLNRGYGVDLSLRHRRPWDSLRARLRETEYAEFFAGALYLCCGEVLPTPSATTQDWNR